MKKVKRERENGEVIDKREREREKGMGEGILSLKKKTFSSFPQTPLHWAASIGSAECVNTLIEHGVNVASKNVSIERVPHTEEGMCGICVIY